MCNEPSPSPPADQPRLYWLDWLRFAAAFAVVADHTRAWHFHEYDQGSDPTHPMGRTVFISLFSLGRQAVVVFFVLSGWLVGGHTIRKVRAGTFDAAAYAADRLSRVYVPLLPALLLTVAVLRVAEGFLDPWQIASCVVGWQDVGSVRTPGGNAPLWTLGYEIWFYVLAGCAAVACRRGSVPWQRLVGTLGAAFAVGVCVALGWQYLVCWLLGVAGPWVSGRIARGARPWVALGGVVLLAAGTAIFQIGRAILPPPPAAIEALLPTPENAQLIVAAGALALVACAASAAPRSRAGLWTERAGVPLASFSYSLYLTHYPVLLALYAAFGAVPPVLTASSTARGLSWMTVCIAVALVMYALFERQTPRARRWLRAKLSALASPVGKNPPAPDAGRLAPAR